MVSVLQESRVHLHLASQHGLHFLPHLVPGGDLFVARGELAVLRDHTQLFLPFQRLHVPKEWADNPLRGDQLLRSIDS